MSTMIEILKRNAAELLRHLTAGFEPRDSDRYFVRAQRDRL